MELNGFIPPPTLLRPESSVKSMPVADIKQSKAHETSDDLLAHHITPIKQSPDEKNNVDIRVRKVVLEKCRNRLIKITGSSSSASLSEFYLAISTMTGGITIGALSSDLTSRPLLYFLYFNIFPMVFAGCLVAFFLTRGNASVSAQWEAKEILNDLPDPDKCV